MMSFAKKDTRFLGPRKLHLTEIVVTVSVGFKNFRLELVAVYQLNSKMEKYILKVRRGKYKYNQKYANKISGIISFGKWLQFQESADFFYS